MLNTAIMAMSVALMGQDPVPVQTGAPTVDVATPTTTAQPAPEPEGPPETRMVCRTETLVGTRFPTRICMRQEHRDVRERDSRALAHRLDAINSNRGRIRAPGRGAD